jgi:hypothetical protein
MPRAKKSLGFLRIVFQEKRLPVWAIAIDRAMRILREDEVGEPTALWFWRFTICVGVNRSARGSVAEKHALTLKSALIKNRRRVLRELSNERQDTAPDSILNEWLATLDCIIDESRAAKTVHWYGASAVGLEKRRTVRVGKTGRRTHHSQKSEL